MSETKIKGEKVVAGTPPESQDLYRWEIVRKDETKVCDWNDDGTKNKYLEGNKTLVPLSNASAIQMVDQKGTLAAKLDVPAGAVVFQRHVVYPFGGVNYNDRWVKTVMQFPETMMALVADPARVGKDMWISCDWDEKREAYIVPAGTKDRKLWPPREIVKMVPQVDYRQYWVFGWRKREADGTVSTRFMVLYPDGKVDEHTSWKDKLWLMEPKWKGEEIV